MKVSYYVYRWGWPGGSLPGMLPLTSCACCPGRSLPTQRALWLGFLRRGANMSFHIYEFWIHLGERILSLGDMKTFCVWGMSGIFCGASWLAILSFIGQLWTHHYRQISFFWLRPEGEEDILQVGFLWVSLFPQLFRTFSVPSKSSQCEMKTFA